MDPWTAIIITAGISAAGNALGGDNKTTQTTRKQLDPPSATENYLLGQLMKPYVPAAQWQQMSYGTGSAGIPSESYISGEKVPGQDCLLIAGREPFGPDDVITDQEDMPHYL